MPMRLVYDAIYVEAVAQIALLELRSAVDYYFFPGLVVVQYFFQNSFFHVEGLYWSLAQYYRAVWNRESQA